MYVCNTIPLADVWADAGNGRKCLNCLDDHMVGQCALKIGFKRNHSMPPGIYYASLLPQKEQAGVDLHGGQVERGPQKCVNIGLKDFIWPFLALLHAAHFVERFREKHRQEFMAWCLQFHYEKNKILNCYVVLDEYSRKLFEVTKKT
jgi:hypothetical protein